MLFMQYFSFACMCMYVCVVCDAQTSCPFHFNVFVTNIGNRLLGLLMEHIPLKATHFWEEKS